MQDSATSARASVHRCGTRFIGLPLLLTSMLLASCSPVAGPDNNWDINVGAYQPLGTIVSEDGTYCRLPSSMPIRPGSTVTVFDNIGNQLGSGVIKDVFESREDFRNQAERFEPCGFEASILNVPRASGYQIHIATNTDSNSATSDFSDVGIVIAFISYTDFSMFFGEEGEKECDAYEGSPVHVGATVHSSPPNQRSAPDEQLFTSQYHSDGNYCSLLAGIYVEPAPTYEIEVGSVLDVDLKLDNRQNF